jgi:ribosomal protein L30
MTIVLVHGTSGCTKRQIRTILALGLKKVGDQKLHKDNQAIRGMVRVVAFLVKVEKKEDATATTKEQPKKK